MKVAVVTDSNSGITQSKAKELGISVIPMPFMINEETFEEDINLTQEQFYEKLVEGAEISTSQPSPETVMNLWSELLKTYDEIVHIPMSSALSSSCQTAMMLAEDFDGRVFVVDNQRISVTQYQSALDAMELARVGLSGAQIKEILEREARESSIYIMVDTLKYLKKGGRITPAAAALGTLLRIKPVLQIQGGKLDSFSKARTVKQAKTTMLSAIAKDLEERFDDPKAEKCWMEIAYSCEKEIAEEFQQEIRQQFSQVQQIHMDPLSLSVACHIGPGALAVAITKKIDAEAERSHYGK
ncbi:MAG: DegV family protein [Monoglobales bacterium]